MASFHGAGIGAMSGDLAPIIKPDIGQKALVAPDQHPLLERFRKFHMCSFANHTKQGWHPRRESAIFRRFTFQDEGIAGKQGRRS
jgi:hypothetical protein